LESSLAPADLQIVLEFNRAARFLKADIDEADLRPERRSQGIPRSNLRASDLIFEVLGFADNDTQMGMDFPEAHFTKIVASLFISYIHNPDYAVAEFYRMLKPGGMLLISSMKPDSDISVLFTDYIRKLQTPDGERQEQDRVEGARAMLNEAASLFELEEDGFFKFYTSKGLEDLLTSAGFVNVTLLSAMGSPPQANIAVAKKRLTLA
jgi:SAM-dependent methyltransferase